MAGNRIDRPVAYTAWEDSMASDTLNGSLRPAARTTRFGVRAVLVGFSLVAGLAYRVAVGVLGPGPLQLGVLLVLGLLWLGAGLFARRQAGLNPYWPLPFAFFIFTVAGILGDSSSWLSLQRAFVLNVLHETPTANNPLAATVWGSVLGQLAGTLGLVLPIILLVRASGEPLSSVYVQRPTNWKWLAVGAAGFVLFYLLAARGISARFFPNNGVTLPRLLALTPALVILVLCNGLREELWFRGLFLKPYGKFLGPLLANLLSAFIFASFHVAVSYSRSLPLFLAIALVQGLILGYLMQKSGSLWASLLFHAGIDIPIFLVYLSFAAS
jgi:membrane protease YdiL (CAAX protease family)